MEDEVPEIVEARVLIAEPDIDGYIVIEYCSKYFLAQVNELLPLK